MISRKPLTQALLACSVAAANGAYAQDVALNDPAINNPGPKLEQITITASRIEMPLRQVGSSVSVLTEEELELKNYPNLDAALRTLPSVRVTQSGGLGKDTTVRIRGEEGHRTLLLVDGMNVADPSGPQISPRFAHILNSQWGRVEVLRGPQGMMYGADAGGVISVFSKESEEPFAADIGAEYGRYNTQRLNGNLRGTLESFNYSVTASDLSSDGFNAFEDEDLAADQVEDDDGYDNTTFHGKAGYQLTDALGVGMVLRDVDAQNEFDNCGFSPSSQYCEGDLQQRSGRFNVHYTGDNHSHELAYTQTDTERLNTVVDQGYNSLDSEGRLEQWQYFGHYEVAEDLGFVYGVDHRGDEFTDNSSGRYSERDQTGLFVEGQTQFGESFFYNVGLRYDDNDDFGEHFSYRLTAAYLLPATVGELRVKGGYGTGFRAPSLYEIAYNNREGAPDHVPRELAEETSKGYELGVEWFFTENSFVELVWFDNTIEDEIYFDMMTFGGYLQSEGETESKGVELSTSVHLLDNLVLGGNYTYNRTRLSSGTTAGAEAGDPRARRPKHAYNLSVQYDFWQDRASVAGFYRSSRDAVDYPFGEGQVALDDYQVLDVTGTVEITPQIETYIRWENVLDEDYQEIANYNTAGSAGYAGVRVSF